jgi:hypothetical protein
MKSASAPPPTMMARLMAVVACAIGISAVTRRATERCCLMAEKTVRAVRIIDTSEIFMNELQDKKEV